MPHYLLAGVPIHGHVTPLLAIAADLAGRGDRVSFLTGRRFAEAVAATGAEFLPLPAAADYDDRLLSERKSAPSSSTCSARSTRWCSSRFPASSTRARTPRFRSASPARSSRPPAAASCRRGGTSSMPAARSCWSPRAPSPIPIPPS